MAVNLQEPSLKRAVAFIDGQNLYRHEKDAFGHHHPNYDPVKLHNAVCETNSWKPHGIRFYTGVPDTAHSPMWQQFWAKRLLAMRRAGIYVYSRPIRYGIKEICLPDGSIWEVDYPQEKGVDVRLALDIMRLAIAGQFDVAVIYSQDQDLNEVAEEIRELAKSKNKWLKIVTAFPASPSATFARGIAKTDWFKMTQEFYDNCLDPFDYRPNALPSGFVPVPTVRLKEPPPK